MQRIEIIDDKIAEIFRQKTPAERLDVAFGLWHSATVLLLNYLKSLHPEWDEATVHKELIRRLSHGAV